MMCKIILLKKEHLDELIELSNTIFKENLEYDEDYDQYWTKKEAIKYFSKFINHKSKILFLIKSRSLIGYISLQQKKYEYRKSKYLEIIELGVVKKSRNKGVAKELLKYAESWAINNNYNKLIVNSYIENKVALDFYSKNGFKEIDINLEKEIDI